MSTVPALNSPLAPTVTTFNAGRSNLFSVFGTNLSATAVTAVQITSSTSGVSWGVNSFAIVSGTELSIDGTPTVIGTENDQTGDKFGNLTVTINPNSNTTKSFATGEVTYKTS